MKKKTVDLLLEYLMVMKDVGGKGSKKAMRTLAILNSQSSTKKRELVTHLFDNHITLDKHTIVAQFVELTLENGIPMLPDNMRGFYATNFNHYKRDGLITYDSSGVTITKLGRLKLCNPPLYAELRKETLKARRKRLW